MASASSLAIAFQFPMAIKTLRTSITTTILPHSSVFKLLRLSPCSPTTVTLINTSLQAIKSHACGVPTSEDGNFSDGGLQRFDTIEFNPAACVLNYGQGIFGELNAYKKLDNSIVLFRPEENGHSLRMGAERLCMPAPTVEKFVEAVKLTVSANTRWILKAHVVAKAKGFSDVLYLDSVENRYVEGTCEDNKIISTPALEGTILPGITRKSIIELACKQGYQVEERSVSVEEFLEADEVFCTGNAVCLSPVGSIT